MASPKIITFFLLNSSTNLPLTGGVGGLAFASYVNEAGTPITPQPSFFEIGGGLYGFTPSYPSASHGISFVITTSANPAYTTGYTRPEDWNTDNLDATVSSVLSAISAIASQVTGAQTDITFIKKLESNKWRIVTAGADANKMIFYDDDGTTPILKVALADINGVASTVNPYSRTPTT